MALVVTGRLAVVPVRSLSWLRWDPMSGVFPGMFCLGYVSFANQPMRRADLEQLAAQSARDNRARRITGVLLYDDGIFLQFLEGEEGTVRNLLARIARDHRHSRLAVVLEEEIPQRHFPDWHMALADAEMFPAECRRDIRDLGDAPPAIPATVASPTIQRLIGTFLRVTKFGYPSQMGLPRD